VETCRLPVVLYGYESWSLTLREEHRLRMLYLVKCTSYEAPHYVVFSENRALRKIVVPKREEVTGG